MASGAAAPRVAPCLYARRPQAARALPMGGRAALAVTDIANRGISCACPLSVSIH